VLSYTKVINILVCYVPPTLKNILQPFLFALCLQHSILAVPMSSDVPMVDAYSDRGSVIMKMTAEMVQMNWIVTIHHVLRKSSHVPTIAVYPCHK